MEKPLGSRFLFPSLGKKGFFFGFGFGFLADILVSYSCCNKVPQMGVLRTTEIDCFIVLEARSPNKSMCWQSHAPSGGAGEVSVLGLSLSFGRFLAWDNTTPMFTWYFPSAHVCPWVQIPSFYKDASHTAHSKRLHCNFITSVKAIPKWGHILRYWGLRIQHIFLRGHNSTHNYISNLH